MDLRNKMTAFAYGGNKTPEAAIKAVAGTCYVLCVMCVISYVLCIMVARKTPLLPSKQ
jgi:hypothetical protein